MRFWFKCWAAAEHLLALAEPLLAFHACPCMQPLLPEYALRKRRRDSVVGLTCPDDLVAQAHRNGLRVANTLTDGRCGLDAFHQGLFDAAKGEHRIRSTYNFKEVYKLRKSKVEVLHHLRTKMAAWMTKNKDVEMWDGMSFQQLTLHMATERRTYAAHVAYMLLPTTWLDAAALHALGCTYSVDVAVLQCGMDPTFVGASLGKLATDVAHTMVTVAMVNDVHFWALLRPDADESDKVGPSEESDNGDWARTLAAGAALGPSSAKRHCGNGGANDDGDECCMEDTIEIEPNLVPDSHVDIEMEICSELRRWSPWDEPSCELVAAMHRKTQLTDESSSWQTVAQQCRRRRKAVEQLLLEAAVEHTAAANLSPVMMYRRAARWHLQKKTSVLQLHDKRAITATEDIQVFKDIRMEPIAESMAKGCGRWGKDHSCLDTFAANLDVVRNWRVLWFSLPPALRRESLLTMCRASLAMHRKSGVTSEWRIQYIVLGVAVCLDAFCAITGIGRSSLTQARNAALEGHQSSLARSELPLHLAILPTSKPHRYLDARRWIEVYAARHAESDSRRIECHLPAGRRVFYHVLYEHDRSGQGWRDIAPLTLFYACWRTECPHIKINKSSNPFLHCGFCDYMLLQIDLTPRADAVLLFALKNRLGEHLHFQSAQRLAENRKEEEADQSGGDEWSMHIDRMDQVKTIFPELHSQRRAGWFQGGARIKCSIIGAYWHGIKNAQFVIRTCFEDFSTGSENQASAMLQNLHSAGLQAGYLPKRWFVGADNTVKETKNQWVFYVLCWLLAVMEGTRLWLTEEGYLLVGHTHGSDDRFFSMIGHVIQGKSYINRCDLMHIIVTELKKWLIRVEHLYAVWRWKEVKDVVSVPQLHGLHHCHAFQVFRSGGIHLRWKQYMTDETWSRSIVMVQPHDVARLALWRPEVYIPKFSERSKMMSFADRIELFLADSHHTLESYKGAIQDLRSTIEHNMEFQRGPSVDEIVNDLVRVGRNNPNQQSNAGAAANALGDQICQFFPGADQPALPLQALVTTHADRLRSSAPPRVLMPGSHEI